VTKTIRVGERTHADLAKLKGEDESFDDVISRLLEDRRDAIREGAGYWSGDDAETAREKVQEMKEEVGGRWSS